MSNGFSIFGWKPVFDKATRFLHKEFMQFVNEHNEQTDFLSTELFLFIVTKDPASSLFQSHGMSKRALCETYIETFSVRIKNCVSPEINLKLQKFEDPTGDIEASINSIVKDIFNRYYLPLIKAEEDDLAIITFEFTKDHDSNVLTLPIESLSLLDRFRFALRLIWGQPDNKDEGVEETLARRQKSHSAKKYLLCLSLYVSEVVLTQVEGVWNVDLSFEDKQDVSRDEIQGVLHEFLNSPIIKEVFAIIEFRKHGNLGINEIIRPKSSDKGKHVSSKGEAAKKKEREPKKQYYITSGRLNDILMLSSRPQPGQQLSLDLKEKTIKRAEAITKKTTSESIEWINSKGLGVKLTSAEYKLIDCISELLADKSQTKDPKSHDYYTGNYPAQKTPYGQGEAVAPRLLVTLHEVAKKYLGGREVGGEDIKIVHSLLYNLWQDVNKWVLVKYENIINTSKTEDKESIEDYYPLVSLPKYKSTKTNKETGVVKSDKKIIVALNPVFIHSITSKWVKRPTNERMIAAAGSAKISTVCYKLRNYLLNELSYNRYSPTIMVDNLYWKIAEDYMTASRKKETARHFNEAAETLKRLGLLEDYKIERAVSGGEKIVFSLNKKWS